MSRTPMSPLRAEPVQVPKTAGGVSASTCTASREGTSPARPAQHRWTPAGATRIFPPVAMRRIAAARASASPGRSSTVAGRHPRGPTLAARESAEAALTAIQATGDSAFRQVRSVSPFRAACTPRAPQMPIVQRVPAASVARSRTLARGVSRGSVARTIPRLVVLTGIAWGSTCARQSQSTILLACLTTRRHERPLSHIRRRNRSPNPRW